MVDFKSSPHLPPLTSLLHPPPDQGSLGEDNLSSTASQSSDLDGGKRSRVRTIFPHKAGSNPTLLSFDEGDIILLLLQEERDGWLYGEVDATKQYVFRADALLSAALCHLL